MSYEKPEENAGKIHFFTYELQQEVMRAINQSQVGDIFKKYGFVGDKVIKFKATLDLGESKSTKIFSDEEMQASLRAIPGEELVLLACCWFSRCNECAPCNQPPC
jgi:hypothetical protein